MASFNWPPNIATGVLSLNTLTGALTLVAGSNVTITPSGSNITIAAPGNFITALTGDVAATGPGSVAATIQASAVTLAKMAHLAANSIIGNNTGSSVTPVALSVAQVQTMLGTSGTNTGDVTLAAVGSTPSANGASLSAQVLTLQPADGTHPGLLTSGSQTIGGAKTFSSTISASNLSGTNTGDQTITLTGDVTGSGTGSFATTLAATTNGTLATLSKSSGVSVHGTNTNDSASSGYLGEVLSVNSPTGGTATPGATGVYVNLASISLTAGDWDVYANFAWLPGGAFVGGANNALSVGISTSSAAIDSTASGGYVFGFKPDASNNVYASTGVRRISLASTTTIYLVGAITYTTLGATTWGSDSILWARRSR